jgi:hypothetical protein
MAWPNDPRPAKALMVLRRKINALAPNRSVANEGALVFGGMLGDDAHQATVSDHNPDTDGVVKATDITKDLAHGIDSRKLAQAILDSKDDRVKYVIANGQIASGSGQTYPQGKWRDRNKGPDDHFQHCHISLKRDAAHYDDERPWELPGFTVAPDPNAPPQLDLPLLKRGSTGDDVRRVQQLLLVDGYFGSVTETAVKDFQREHGLVVDGVVGNYTWRALLLNETPRLPTDDGIDTAAIGRLVADSSLAKADWSGRGAAPIGYLKGMAVAFADCLVELRAGDAVANEMAKANTGDDTKDALSWFNSNFKAKGWSNNVSGQDTLRHLFVLMIGLGMRESSGIYWMGRDVSSSIPASADTAEAGLFQQSWDSRVASPLLPLMLASGVPDDGYLSIFREGVRTGSSSNVGTGPGAKFQLLCKTKPMFAVECAAVGLRNIRDHWGPINRKEVELRTEADDLLLKVQTLVNVAVAAAKPVLAKTIAKPSVAKPMPSPPPEFKPDAMAEAIASSERVAIRPASPVTTEAAGPTEGSSIMKNDSTLWAMIRYIMIGVGGLLVGKGVWGITQADVPDIVDKVMPIGGAIISGGAAIWGIFVTYNTRAVPITVAARPDIPTVSPVTGAVEPPAKFTPPVPLAPLKG